ncbi:hypothetical protein [Brevibacillus sp. H7]|uniref:hypothetical protein n=1 Tax=Brevibacillus sp. H7 TaxID=3349138 RepID=UPI003825788E
MNNEHIWELMQRDLDNDLSPQEQLLLCSSVRKDPGLQLMYERLKRVSDQLEQLPPVTPKISIVDSILPQLEAPSRMPSTVAMSAESELPRLELKKDSPREQRPKWKGLPLWMARAGSGLVAACMLLGLFFMVNHPSENGPDGYRQGNAGIPPSTSAPAVTVPPLPEKESTHVTPPSDENAKPPEAKQEPSQTKTNKPNSKPKSKETKPTVNPKPINTKPAVTAPAVEKPKPSFPYGTETKPGLDDKRDKDTDENRDEKDKDKKKFDDKRKDKKGPNWSR